MINDVTACMWGIFDETGIFLALCWHGFVLVVVDMIQSGELCVKSLVIPCEASTNTLHSEQSTPSQSLKLYWRHLVQGLVVDMISVASLGRH